MHDLGMVVRILRFWVRTKSYNSI